MTQEMIQQLVNAGLTKHQATSVTAETLVNLFMHEDGTRLIAEAQRQVSEMQTLVNELKDQYNSLLSGLNDISATILSITEAQSDHGAITDDKAKNLVALYAALLSMNINAGADPSDAVKNTSYVVYAYLGGQAKREITYLSQE